MLHNREDVIAHSQPVHPGQIIRSPLGLRHRPHLLQVCVGAACRQLCYAQRAELLRTV
jgi:hypothetical protein